MATPQDDQIRPVSERREPESESVRHQGNSLRTRDNLSVDARRRCSAAGNAAKARKATAFAASVAPVIDDIRAQGITSDAAIARELEARGIPSPRGGKCWWPNQVARIERLIRASAVT